MRIALLTAGAGQMYCGSCTRDNALAKALRKLGHEVRLIALYTPLRVDSAPEAERGVFLPGTVLYLRSAFPWIGLLPRACLAPLRPSPVVRTLTRLSGEADYASLGRLTVQVLEGGGLEEELDGLVRRLARGGAPEVVLLSTPLLGAVGSAVRKSCGAKVIATLQGDDQFLEHLPEPSRARAIALLRARCLEMDGLIAVSGAHRDFVARYLRLSPSDIAVAWNGVDPHPYPLEPPRREGPPRVGYLARVTPRKGLLLVAQAALQAGLELRAAGYLAREDRGYLVRCGAVHYQGEPDLDGKIAFLRSVGIGCVAPLYAEPFGLYALESLAAWAPFVAPAHGAFPELAEATGAIALFEPGSAADLSRVLRELADDEDRRREMASRGVAAVRGMFSAESMGRRVLAICERTVKAGAAPGDVRGA